MAITTLGQFSYTLQDASGDEVAVQRYVLLNPAATLAQIRGYCGTTASALDAVTDAQIVRGRICLPVAFSGLKGTPASGSAVEHAAVFGCSVVGTNRRYAAIVPAIAAAVLSGDRVNLSATAVLDFTSDLTFSGSANYFYTNEEWQQLDALLDAITSFRKVQRARLARSSRVR